MSYDSTQDTRMHMLTATDLLFHAFQPPEIDIPAEPLAHGVCAISGKPIAAGVPIARLVTAATNQPHEIFKVPHTQHVSIEAARLFKQMKIGGITGNLLALLSGSDYAGHRPMVSRDSALKANRPCWHDVVMRLPDGTPTVAIFSTDTKRRLWVHAPLGVVGPAWAIYLHDDYVSRPITVHIGRVRECMALLEHLYMLGFSKDAMRASLYDFKTWRDNNLSLSDVVRWERELSAWRGTMEFQLAVFIVQKPLEQSRKEEDTWIPEQLSSPQSNPQMALFG